MSKLKFASKILIEKGWSSDKKYCAVTEDGTKYLLRISPKGRKKHTKSTFLMQRELDKAGIPMCVPIEFGRCKDGVYTVQTWIDGKEAEEIVPLLSDSEQYALGIEAGRILRKIHSIPAPKKQPEWEKTYNAKIDKKIKAYNECPAKFDGAEHIINYIEANRHLLKNRPQCFQHGDYHRGNMMIENGRIVIIDFDRYDFGDPWEDMKAITWDVQLSPYFASGRINGYFGGEVPLEFWKLLALYISVGLVSAFPWAIPFGEGEIQTFRNQAKDVLSWYDNMNNPIPAWYIKDYYLQYMDGVPFKLKLPFDFSFISKYGRVFKVFDDQDSGNICFGTEKDGQKYFVKFAGAPTKEYNGTADEAIERLKSTLPIYKDLKHKNLIEFVSAEEIGGGFAVVFKWAEGDCAGRQYPEAHRKFIALPNEVKLKAFSDVLDFLAHVNSQGYVAIDFYDGSILYDHESGKTTICDIDLFQKQPYINDMGRMWGSAKFMSPEEFECGAAIDEITNVYTAGAFAFALFGRYERKFEKWSLSKALFDVAAKAVSDARSERQQSIKRFIEEWETARTV